MKLLARQICRTGVQSLWYDEETQCYYVSIKNRTYESTQPIPVDKVEIWADLLGGVRFNAQLMP